MTPLSWKHRLDLEGYLQFWENCVRFFLTVLGLTIVAYLYLVARRPMEDPLDQVLIGVLFLTTIYRFGFGGLIFCFRNHVVLTRVRLSSKEDEEATVVDAYGPVSAGVDFSLMVLLLLLFIAFAGIFQKDIGPDDQKALALLMFVVMNVSDILWDVLYLVMKEFKEKARKLAAWIFKNLMFLTVFVLGQALLLVVAGLAGFFGWLVFGDAQQVAIAGEVGLAAAYLFLAVRFYRWLRNRMRQALTDWAEIVATDIGRRARNRLFFFSIKLGFLVGTVLALLIYYAVFWPANVPLADVYEKCFRCIGHGCKACGTPEKGIFEDLSDIVLACAFATSFISFVLNRHFFLPRTIRSQKT
jgi:hypothetical protein